MPLYFIGLGLGNEKDITINGLEAVKKCDLIYLESYTSILSCTKEDLEKLYGKKIILAPRQKVEADDNEILQNAKGKKCHIIHNASIISAIGATGLQAYKFGKTTSIPFDNEAVEAPYAVMKGNLSLGLHTLFLLDLNPEEEKFMTINDAIRYLLKIELTRNEKIFSEKTLCVGCARIGNDNQLIKAGTAKELLKFDFGKPVHCLIVPGNIHFMEEEALGLYKL